MKKYVLTIIFIGFGLLSKTQSIPTVGIHGGLNINTATGNAISNDFKEALNAFNAGVHFNAPLSKQFSIRTLLQYEQNGWEYRDLTIEATPGYITPADMQFKMNYLSLYSLAEYSFG